jgi:hypothetical protein
VEIKKTIVYQKKEGYVEETHDVSVINYLDLSLLASEILLSILEAEYGDDNETILKEESVVIPVKELKKTFDGITGKQVLANMREYGSDTNMKGLTAGVREIYDQIADLNDEDIVELDFQRVLEAL